MSRRGQGGVLVRNWWDLEGGHSCRNHGAGYGREEGKGMEYSVVVKGVDLGV